MSRPIKFRAMLSDEYVKTMKNPQKIWNHSGDYAMTEEFSENEMRGMPEFFAAMDLGHYDRTTLSQFTGLLDKNGKEIYEGDIVNINAHHPRGRKIQWVVGWFGDSARFGLVWNTGEPGMDIGRVVGSRNWDVIGNIYENPELLSNQ